MRISSRLFQSQQGSTIKEAIQKIRSSNLHPSVQKATHFKNPLLVKNASMQWIYDTNNKKYLDLFGGIVTVSVGHCHPRVNDALMTQASKLWHTTNIYLNEPLHEYVAKLVSTLPGNLKVVYPVNSGSEANDLAILMARAYTGNFDIIALRNGYHGMSPQTMGLTGHSTWKQNVGAHYAGIHHAMNPDCYQGLFGGCRDSPVQTTHSKCTDKTCSAELCASADPYIEQLNEVLKYSVPQKKVAGFFAESIQGVGGVVQFPRGYIKKAFDLIRSNGGICISDEVQTGFGRTGDNMWHFQDHGVIPDIVSMAKSIGNGFPMAAVVTTPEIAKCMANVNHFNTFGGNPLASAVGKAVLEVIEEENLQQNAKVVGTYFLHQLKNLQSEFPSIIGDVRGKGLMIGIEMVQNPESRQPIQLEKMNNIWEDLKDSGILVGKGGFYGNTFRISPPLCISKADVDLGISVFRDVLKKHV